MSKRLVIVAYGLDTPSLVEKARAVSGDFEVVYLPVQLPPDALRTYASGTAEAREALNQRYPAEFMQRLPEAEVIYSLHLPVDLLKRAPKLKWVANMGSGTEQYGPLGVLGSGVTLTSSKGVAARSIAEFVMAQLLALNKRLPERGREQAAHRWTRMQARDLHGQTLGIVGLGEIGAEAARFAKAFGMRVLATRRRPMPELPPNVDATYPTGELRAMLAECDAVVLALAFTPETRNLIGRAELAAMKKGSFLINVARGEVLDEVALLEALKNGPMAGAALDVFAKEPLPKDSPFWDLPNLVISAHNSVTMAHYSDAAFEAFVENFKRYARGEALQRVVDPVHRY